MPLLLVAYSAVPRIWPRSLLLLSAHALAGAFATAGVRRPRCPVAPRRQETSVAAISHSPTPSPALRRSRCRMSPPLLAILCATAVLASQSNNITRFASWVGGEDLVLPNYSTVPGGFQAPLDLFERMAILMNLLRTNTSSGEDIATSALDLINDSQRAGDTRSGYDLTTLCLEAVPDPEAELHKAALRARGAILLAMGRPDLAGAAASEDGCVHHRFGGHGGLPSTSEEPMLGQAEDETTSSEQHVYLIDSFPFNGELVAEIRLNATAHLFDLIIIVEAWETHSVHGRRKEFLFSETPYWSRVFARFEGKVKIVVVSTFPLPSLSWVVHFCGRVPIGDLANYRSWWREYYQRNIALIAIPAEMERYLLVVSDADEVVAVDLLQEFSGSRVEHYNLVAASKIGAIFLSMEFRLYNWNWGSGGVSMLSFLTSDRLVTAMKADPGNLYSLSAVRLLPLNEFVKMPYNLRTIEDAGWHLTYFLPPLEVQRKLKSFSHTEYVPYLPIDFLSENVTHDASPRMNVRFDRPQFTSLEAITSRIQRGEDLFNRSGADPLRPAEPPAQLLPFVDLDYVNAYLAGQVDLV